MQTVIQTTISTTGRKIILSTSGITKAGARNDCSVRALANASNIPYATSEAMHKRNGRINNTGTEANVLYKTYAEAGFELQGVYGDTKQAWWLRRVFNRTIEQGMTLSTFLKRNTKGKYICLVSGHAFAVVDGVVIDNQHLLANKRITAVFKPMETGLESMLNEIDS